MGPYLPSRFQACFRWTPHPVIVTVMDNRDYIRVLLYSYYTTITGWGVLLRHAAVLGLLCGGLGFRGLGFRVRNFWKPHYLLHTHNMVT